MQIRKKIITLNHHGLIHQQKKKLCALIQQSVYMHLARDAKTIVFILISYSSLVGSDFFPNLISF